MTNTLPDDQLFTLSNASDMRVTISARGAAPVSWLAPDRYGRLAEVLLARTPTSATQLWQGEQDDDGVSLRMHSATGPLALRYRLADDGSLCVEGDATPVQPFFNLNGGAADVGDHMLQIDADFFIEISEDGVPAAKAMVGGTAFDFRQPAAIGPRLAWLDPQLKRAGGFNHCYFMRAHSKGRAGLLREVARAVDPGSGRQLLVSTTEPAVQFASGPALDGFSLATQSGTPGKHTTVYRVLLQH